MSRKRIRVDVVLPVGFKASVSQKDEIKIEARLLLERVGEIIEAQSESVRCVE